MIVLILSTTVVLGVGSAASAAPGARADAKTGPAHCTIKCFGVVIE